MFARFALLLLIFLGFWRAFMQVPFLLRAQYVINHMEALRDENSTGLTENVTSGGRQEWNYSPRRMDFQTPIKNHWDVEWVLLLHVSGDVERYNAVRNTWFRKLSDDVGLVHIGMERLSGTNVSGVFNSPAIQNNAFETTRRAFALALRAFPFATHISKFDDDAYVYSRELIRQVRADGNGSDYWGYPILLDNQAFGSGGAGYVLSRGAAQKLVQCESPIPYEDAAVGHCMRSYGIGLKHLVGLHPHHPYQMLRWDKHGHPSDRLTLDRQIVISGYMNPLSYHYIAPIQMLQMHDDIHLHGAPMQRSRSIPHIVH